MMVNFVENNKNMSDEEIINLINLGNYDLLQIIMERYYPVVLFNAQKYCPDALEDAIQEGNLALYYAVKSYNGKKSSFNTFASLCIKRSMLSVLRGTNRKKDIPKDLVSSINDTEIVDINNPEQMIIEKESLETLKNNIKLELSALEYKVLQLHLSGKDYEEIGNFLNISSKSVDNALWRIRKKLKVK